MNFQVNDTTFSGNIDTSDLVKIQSYNKKYRVDYSKKKLAELINENYDINDFIVIDRNVLNLDSNCLLEISKNNYYILDANEDNKIVDTVLIIVDSLLKNNFSKKNKLIVIGGGITQDISGFVCAIYKRGLNWILIPTTLLSMTDSCIGGKVGVNRSSKNMLSLFCSPNKVIISDYFLESLKYDDIISGIGEALKLSLIGGLLSYEYFQENYTNLNYLNIIKMATSVKKLIIEHDELEFNERRVLNYGHTFGHAIESCSSYFIPHGIAVMFGMYIINKLFYKNKYDELNNFILNMIPDKFKKISMSYKNFINSILNDKKNDGDNVCFILLNEVGNSIFVFKKIDEINDDLHYIFNEVFTSV